MTSSEPSDNSSVVSRVAIMSVLALAFIVPGLSGHVWADQDPPGCNTTALNVSITKNPAGEVCDGATINYIVCFQNPTRALPQIQCAATEVKGFLDLPGPSPRTQVFSRARLNPGDPQICCPGGVGCEINAALYTYIVSHADEIASRVQATTDADGTAHSAPGDPDQATGSAQVTNLVRHPRLTVTKECVLPVPPFPNPIPFRGTVCNTGDAILSGLTVVDDKAGAVVCRDGTGAAVDELAAGACCSYTGQYVPNSCSLADTTDTVTATATASTIDQTSTCNRTVRNSASVTCTPQANPRLIIEKTCTDATSPGQPILVRVRVSNGGDDTLNNVAISDDKATLTCALEVVNGIVQPCPSTLLPGQACVCTGSYVPSQQPCLGQDTDTATATATGACSGRSLRETDSATCNFPCRQGVCRTPGFWGTHADADDQKECSQDVTAAAIALGGPHASCPDCSAALHICGECLVNGPSGTLDPDDAASALEALCVRVRGFKNRQLARQLTAAALNCVISRTGNDCATDPVIGSTFTICNQVCATGSGALSAGECIKRLDCFNNGFQAYDPVRASCTGDTGCHEQALPLDLLFPSGTRCTTTDGRPRLGPAGSSDECSAARVTSCTAVGASERDCGSDSGQVGSANGCGP